MADSIGKDGAVLDDAAVFGNGDRMSWQASGWALELYLGDARRKMVLVAIANYADSEGKCAFPSLNTLAKNCDLKEGALKRRIRELEEIGIINRFVRRIVAGGKVVSEQASGPQRDSETSGGRRTSDEFWVDMQMSADAVKAKVEELFEKTVSTPHDDDANEDESDTTIISDTCESETISPPLASIASVGHVAPRTPSDTPHREGGILPSNPPGRIPPQPPQGGASDQDFEKDWQEFKSTYPDGMVDPDAAKREFAQLPPPDRKLCNSALPVYADRLRKRREKSIKAHLFVRKRSWEGILASPTEGSDAPRQIEPASRAGKALGILAGIARYRPFVGPNGRLIFHGEVTERLLAMAEAPADVVGYKRGSPNFAAWWGFLGTVFAGCNLPALTEILAPWPWPPKADGSIYSAEDSTGPPDLVPGTLATESDLDEMAKG